MRLRVFGESSDAVDHHIKPQGGLHGKQRSCSVRLSDWTRSGLILFFGRRRQGASGGEKLIWRGARRTNKAGCEISEQGATPLAYFVRCILFLLS